MRGIYLPVGADWVDWWTGARYESGKIHYLTFPPDRLPVFVRVGAVIPTQNVIQNTTEMPSAEITLNVVTGIAPNKTETSILFQDAGDGYGYLKNDWREIRFEHKQGSLKINKYGDFKGQKIKYIEAVGMTNKAKEIKADGKVLDQNFDADRKRIRVEIDENTKEILMMR